MISKALSEYLKTMYVLKKQKNEIRVTDIANKMNCTKPSVNKALKNLKEENLIKYEAYQEIVLTKEGEDLAKKILEAYDIAYVFFKDVLNLDEKEAEEEAGKIKSTLNDDTLNRLAKYVQKQLDYNSLDCNYDINNERCRSCVRRMPKKS